ncbi:MAG: AglZ/HisF2 family acetamidino modification protein [Chitinophagaceae bacterium]
MLKTRIIPCLQLVEESLVKTVKFSSPGYIGDPVNTVRIFNELEVDELAFIDIRASVENRKPNFEILHQISDECFMPLSYGGGINHLDIAKEIFSMGFEKVILNSASFKTPKLITEIAKIYGSQAVVISIDVKKSFLGKYEVFSSSGTVNQKLKPVEWMLRVEELGAGEILLTSIDREGSWKGFDIELVKQVAEAASIPVIAHGGASSIEDIGTVVKEGKASAVALGSMVVYQQKGMGVLVNFPDKEKLEQVLSY